MSKSKAGPDGTKILFNIPAFRDIIEESDRASSAVRNSFTFYLTAADPPYIQL